MPDRRPGDVIILSATDYRNRTVILTDRVWRQKILGKHPEVIAYWPDAIRACLSTPEIVTIDADDPLRRCQYITLEPSRQGLIRYLKIVLVYTAGMQDGMILSIYRSKNIPVKERREWPI